MLRKIFPVAILSIALTGCAVTVGTLVMIAQLAADAASSVIQAADPAIAPIVVVGTSAFDCAASVIEGGGTKAQISAGVLDCVAGININPVLPAGTNANVVAAVQGFFKEFAALIQQYTAKSPAMAARLAGPEGQQKMTLTWMDKRKLSQIHAMNHKTIAALAAIKK